MQWGVAYCHCKLLTNEENNNDHLAIVQHSTDTPKHGCT